MLLKWIYYVTPTGLKSGIRLCYNHDVPLGLEEEIMPGLPCIVNSLPFCNNKEENCKSKLEGNECLECIFPDGSDILPAHIYKKKFVDSIYSKIEPI